MGPPDTSFQAGNKTGGSWKGQVLGRAPSLLEEHAVRLSEAGFGVVTGICPAPALGSGTQALISPPVKHHPRAQQLLGSLGPWRALVSWSTQAGQGVRAGDFPWWTLLLGEWAG